MRHLALSLVVALTLSIVPGALAQGRRVEVHFTPTVRAQIAVWIERADGTLFETVRLTDAVAFRGIGNRPGALQMNSGYHWPYGRREGVLPVWAHRRHELTGALFPRVVFAGRASEGNASSAGSRGEVVNTRDNYYCLSFRDGDESLDAVTCASVFMSNKGRYLNEADVAAGYGEPWEDSPDGTSGTRALELGSLYPPRQDLGYCDGCADHQVESVRAARRTPGRSKFHCWSVWIHRWKRRCGQGADMLRWILQGAAQDAPAAKDAR